MVTNIWLACGSVNRQLVLAESLRHVIHRQSATKFACSVITRCHDTAAHRWVNLCTAMRMRSIPSSNESRFGLELLSVHGLSSV